MLIVWESIFWICFLSLKFNVNEIDLYLIDLCIYYIFWVFILFLFVVVYRYWIWEGNYCDISVLMLKERVYLSLGDKVIVVLK